MSNPSVIPVLIGPQIPRKDREETMEKYCRAILTLFVPWSTCTDLCNARESWKDAWKRHEEYLYNCEYEYVIQNIELLHECKEHKNQHLIKQLDTTNVNQPCYKHLDKEFESEEELDEESSSLINILDVFEDHFSLNETDYANNALKALIKTNRFQDNKNSNTNANNFVPVLKHYNKEKDLKENLHTNIKSLLLVTDELYKKNDVWQLNLKMEKERLRKFILYDSSDSSDSNIQFENSPKQTFNENNDVVVATMEIDTQKSIISKYTLNEAQTQAFLIISDHLDGKSFLNKNKSRQEQLIMCIPASAGTGKSHLNKALTEYFKITGRLSILRKLAPTSAAANGMGENGLTMQSFIHGRQPKTVTKNRKANIEMEWKHIKYVFFMNFR